MKKLLLITVLAMATMSGLMAQTYKLYGYENNKYSVYLGEVTVQGSQLYENKYSTDSIFNRYGNFGSEYSIFSIWNKYGTWGSEYQTYSATNRYSTNPPAIVDLNGNIVGYLTANNYLSNTYLGKKISQLVGVMK